MQLQTMLNFIPICIYEGFNLPSLKCLLVFCFQVNSTKKIKNVAIITK